MRLNFTTSEKSVTTSSIRLDTLIEQRLDNQFVEFQSDPGGISKKLPVFNSVELQNDSNDVTVDN